MNIFIHQAICGEPHSKNGEGKMGCLSKFPSWSWDKENNKCVPFTYGGCLGNDNRFSTKEECQHKCDESHGSH